MAAVDKQTALVPADDSTKIVAIKSNEFKVPKPRRKKVLEEDEYEESITKIIERDFYPELPKLRAQSEYLEAKAKNDREKLRELHIKYGPKGSATGSRRQDPSATDLYTTPASFDTPGVKTPSTSTEKITKGTAKESSKDSEEKVTTNTELRLDKFLSSHTSEDNEAFVDLMEEHERKRKEKQAWLYVKEGEQKELADRHLALPSAEEQAALEGNPTKLETWTYTPANALMYNVEGAELTAEEKIELASKVKEINPNATRFTENPFKEPVLPTSTPVPIYRQHRGVPGRVDVDGKELGPTTPSVRGYGFVSTPTPNPGALGESPMMTWGEIEGTPFLLDASDRPLKPATPGPTFKLKDEPVRDRIGRKLAEKVAKQHRDKKNQAVEKMRSHLASPAGMSKSERLATLSPAARKLAETRGITITTDRALRASYTPSPLHTPATFSRTPSHSRKRDATPSTHTPKAMSSTNPSNIDNLTSNLLDLSSKKKAKASDFF